MNGGPNPTRYSPAARPATVYSPLALVVGQAGSASSFSSPPPSSLPVGPELALGNAHTSLPAIGAPAAAVVTLPVILPVASAASADGERLSARAPARTSAHTHRAQMTVRPTPVLGEVNFAAASTPDTATAPGVGTVTVPAR